MNYVTEPAKKIPIVCRADICVIGGSATGVFAAVRAARLGAKVVLVERSNCFGGTATGGLVNIWHTYYDTTGKKQIIAGLSEEITDRIEPFNNGYRDYAGSHCFNPNELKIELDRLLTESGVKYYLHTYYAGLMTDGDRITSVFIENKDGRGAIVADFFIDATGDGDLARDLKIESYVNPNVQPPSACFLMQGTFRGVDYQGLIREHGKEFGLENDWGWGGPVPRCRDISMRAETHVFGVRCDSADDLTKAEVEGRRKMRALVEMLNKYSGTGDVYNIISACSMIGIRETVHYKTIYKATEDELLSGARYPDAVLNGSYNVDVHLQGKGITFRRLDGSYQTEGEDGEVRRGNWREENGIRMEEVPTYYQLPFRCLVPETWGNFIAVGRMINADVGAFGALRVMVNLNQLGEAAGVAAYLALHRTCTVQELDGREVALTLSRGGSANLV